MSETGKIYKLFGLLAAISKIIGAIVIYLFIGNYILAAGDYVKDFLSPDSAAWDGRVYESYPERKEVIREVASTWNYEFTPYYHWRRKEFHGKYINVDSNGLRQTIKDPKAGARRVFVFGGSNVWGSDVADGQTIPSYLQAILGDGYDIYNYGELGYVSAQEVNRLMEQLAFGNVPDAVIFYDGSNESYNGAYSPAVPRAPISLGMGMKELEKEKKKHLAVKVYEATRYKKLVDFLRKKLRKGTGKGWDELVEGGIDGNARAVVEVYDEHIRQVKSLSREYGFKAFFFWQPYLFSMTREPRGYEAEIIKNASPVHIEAMRKVYQRARERFSGREDEDIYFLADIFNDIDEPIYMDYAHILPKGNRIVAEEIVRRIDGKL